MNFLKTAWAFISSNVMIAVSAVGAIMFAIIKYQSRKIDKLEHKEKIHYKIEENKQSQEEFKAEVLADEPERIKENIKNRAKFSRHDRASKL